MKSICLAMAMALACCAAPAWSGEPGPPPDEERPDFAPPKPRPREDAPPPKPGEGLPRSLFGLPGVKPPPKPDDRRERPPLGPPRDDGPRPPLRPDWTAYERQDPEMAKLFREDDELDRQARDLAMRYRWAPASERDAIKAKLGELVGKQFEVRQQRRVLEVKRLEEEIQRLRDAVERRKQARDSLINKRILQLTGEDDVQF